MSPELRHLRYFVAVAEELHFGRAAARLHMAQPPLSQAIQRLERDLGVVLLRRTTRRVELTRAGAALLDEARALVEQLDGAVERVRQAARQESGRIVAGFLGSTVHSLAPEIARAWHERHPEVGLDVEEIPLDEQLDGLAGGRLDVAFVRPPVDVAGFRHTETAAEPVCAVFPADDPLAARTRLVMEDLDGETWVMLLPYEQQAVGWARQAGFTPRVAERARSVHTYLGLIAAGIGIGLMPWSARHMRADDVVFVPVEGLSTWVSIVWRDERESPALRELIELAQAAAADIALVSNVG